MNFIEHNFGWIVGIFFAVCIGLIVIGVVAVNRDEQRLMQQCMDDGKKEYECRSMLRSNSSTVVPMPIIVPIGSRR